LSSQACARLEHLLGRKAQRPKDEEALAREGVESGWAEIVALTLGAAGAVLATKDLTLRLPSSQIKTRSAVGAGESLGGGMVVALARGRGIAEAFVQGLAAGAAAAMTTGTELCRRDDVAELYAEVSRELPVSAHQLPGTWRGVRMPA
jgi:6-phosphofructokinase 2